MPCARDHGSAGIKLFGDLVAYELERLVVPSGDHEDRYGGGSERLDRQPEIRRVADDSSHGGDVWLEDVEYGVRLCCPSE